MFFRREQPKNPTFADRIESLRKAGFTTAPQTGGAVRASRANCAVDLKEEDSTVHAGVAGVARWWMAVFKNSSARLREKTGQPWPMI
jgi:hypothetical protein